MATASESESQSRSRLVELFDSEKYYPVLEVLSSYLTMADALALCHVCKGLDGLRNYMLRRISNINVRLRDFVDDPVMFRSQLGKYGALISGPFALNTLELGYGKVVYLDVFIEDGTNADQFTRYLQDSEEFQNDSPEVEATQTRWIGGSSTRSGTKLRITRTSGPPIQTILTASYTTACVNFITWNKAYSIFPRQTLIDHRFYLLRSPGDDFGSSLNELADQGWTTRDIIWPDFPKAPKLDGLRRVGDSSTLVIPLDTNSVQTPSTPDSIIDYAQFEVSQNQAQQQNQGQQSRLFPNQPQRNPFQIQGFPLYSFLNIRANKLTSLAIRYGYTTASTGWHQYVKKRLLRWAWLEWYKLKSKRPPLQSTNVLPLVSNVPILPQDFEMPPSWDYADDQIPRWYREWEQQVGKGVM